MFETINRSIFYATLDIRRRFKMSLLGPIWSVVSTIVISLIIFSVLSGLSLGKNGYSDLVIGLHIWSCTSGFVSESMHTFVASSGLLRNTRLGIGEVYSRYFVSQIAQMMITCTCIGFFTAIYNQDIDSGIALVFFPIFFSPVLFFLGLNLAIAGARFRDLASFVAIVLQVLFYATPILWATSMLPISPFWNQFNVFYYLIEWVRSPGLFTLIEAISLWVAVFLCFYLAMFHRFRNRVVYWV